MAFRVHRELGYIARDPAQLAEAGHKLTRGDTRCIVFGHLTRMAVWNLRKGWDRSAPTAEKLERFAQAIMQLADPEELLHRLASGKRVPVPAGPLFATAESNERSRDAVAF